MLINSTVKVDSTDFLIRMDSDSRSPSFPLLNNILSDNKKSKSIKLNSIEINVSTIRDILGNGIDYNDDIYIFNIEGKVSSNIYSWKVYKNNKQIKELFEQIKKELSKRENVDEYLINKCKIVKKYTDGELYRNIKKIGEFLVEINNNTRPNQPEELKEALRISKTSFLDNEEMKPFEGYAYKKAEPRILRTILKYVLFPIEYFFFSGWNKRWIVLKNDMICYLNNPNTIIGKNVYWFDEDIEIKTEKDKILIIKNLSKTLVLKFDSKFEKDIWKQEIELRIRNKQEEFFNNNIYNSFSYTKSNCEAKWFVDGHNYFCQLFEKLKYAKESVYITDWFLSPELALIRPLNYNDFIDEKKDYKKNLDFSNVSRLMDIFYLLAKRGVKIYILLFCEVSLALAINSSYTKRTLKKLHENIKITRHPKMTTKVLWSHHEKLVIIDQKVAFVGGLDLCWGRYDTNNHPIVEVERDDKTYNYPGSDYINERQVDLHEVDKFYKEQIDRNERPRMAWHDVQTMVEGPIVNDIVRHFVERWNDARFNKRDHGIVNIDSSKSMKKKKSEKFKKINDDDEIKNKIKTTDQLGLFKRSSKTLKDKEINLINKISSNIEDIKEENEDDFIEDDNIIISDNKEDKKNNIIYTSTKKDNNLIKNDLYDENLDNHSNLDIEENSGRFTLFKTFKNKVKNKVKVKLDDYKKKHNIKDKEDDIKQKVNFSNDEKGEFKINALRSVCNWSIGKDTTERSILQGYYKLIDNAQHYIYIENQFFITKSFSEEERSNSGLNLNKLVQNEIGLHIRERIERAYKAKSNFKVFVFIPLLPGFSGTPGESSTINCILKHTYQSIAHNKGMSLLEKLRETMGEDVNKYIYFFSLRNHGKIKEIPVTELIYIHSKLLIVDDEKVLIGSANINDRSMMGDRDSEFAIIIEEGKKVKSSMDNKEYMASKYALSLRKHLMAEHMGLESDNEIFNDPLNDKLWNEMRDKAKKNSQAYSDIFDCFPDNKFNNFAKLKERKIIKTQEDKEELKKLYDENSSRISGHIVQYPINFLKDQELDIDFFSKENLIPERNFV